jgi:geranylgeranyl reductase family protein
LPRPDVLIIGAGPAGATAARRLALGGARVRLVDRERFPRNKPCGGAISIRALARFPYLPAALARIPTHYIARLYLESPGGESVTLTSASAAALMIRRMEFDHLLVQLALEAGVELVEGVEISRASIASCGVALTARNGRKFEAPMVIAADGVHSVVARRLGLNRGWPQRAIALDMMEETPSETLRASDPDTLWVSYGYQGSDGYAYVFPKRDHVNAGIGYLLSYYREAVRQRPYESQRRFVGSLTTKGVLAGASSRLHFTPFLIPVGGPLPHTARGRVLLAGDAGGFVNAFSAEGIYYAMVSGELAADAILSERPNTYEPRWRRELGAELRDAVWVQRYLFADSRRVDAMVRGARAYPAVASGLVEYAMGSRSYQGARMRLVSHVPAVAARVALSGLLGFRL